MLHGFAKASEGRKLLREMFMILTSFIFTTVAYRSEDGGLRIGWMR